MSVLDLPITADHMLRRTRRGYMLYALHEAAYRAAAPLRLAAKTSRDFWRSPNNLAVDSQFGRTLYASADVFANMTRQYGRPAWGIDSVVIGGETVRVDNEVAWQSPWVTLRRFRRSAEDLARIGRAEPAPPLLIVAPLSGHFATLLRGTVEAFLQDYDVWVTDWSNARDVPLMEGRFGFHDYIDTVMDILRRIGGRAHVVAVCQPGPPVMAAATLMAEDGDPARPASLILMGSPIDARLSPTVTNNLAEERPFAWFQSNMIYTVPAPYVGVFRRVYPGFVQLYSFMSMNAEMHRKAHQRYFERPRRGRRRLRRTSTAPSTTSISRCSISARSSTSRPSISCSSATCCPRASWSIAAARSIPAKITDIGLMTVEGEKDDISGVGQTQAAHGLCPNVPDDIRELYVQPGVGHYGVFNGRRFVEEIYPRVRDFVARREGAFLTA